MEENAKIELMRLSPMQEKMERIGLRELLLISLGEWVKMRFI